MAKDHEKKLDAAMEAAKFMEESLSHDFTAAHEIYLDPDVTEGGMPFVSVTVSGDDGVRKLSDMFGDEIAYSGLDAEQVIVPVIVKPLKPGNGMD